MIKGVHAMFYAPEADALRTFLKDQLGLPFVDTGGGWLIFSLRDAEVASHPAAAARHQLSFYCDDLQQTMAELRQRGVVFTGAVSEEEWGWLTHFKLPDGGEVELYQPKYSLAGARPAGRLASWQDFAAAAPELADFAFERLDERIAYLATLTAQGAPRVHPVSPFIGGGRLYVYMEPTSPKVRDLARDARYSMHCAVEDNDGGQGELSLTGRARLVLDPAERTLAFDTARAANQSPEERYVVFELALERVLATTYAGGKAYRRRWPPPLSG
jgi:catechol 2,3-dioxygenase-like lactoylglutathione lyase family enzyme